MTPSHSWVSMSLLMGILTSIILMSLKYPCIWVFKEASIDFDICHRYLCKYLWQVYGLESIFMMCQDLKMKIMTLATIKYTWIIILIDNWMISVSSLSINLHSDMSPSHPMGHTCLYYIIFCSGIPCNTYIR